MRAGLTEGRATVATDGVNRFEAGAARQSVAKRL